MTANMNCKSMSRRPRDPMAGIAIRIVSKIIYSFYARLIKRSTLSTLKRRTIVACMEKPSPTPGIKETAGATREAVTTKKSKQFQLSLKQAIFSAINLIIASTVKIPMNTIFTCSIIRNKSGDIQYQEIVKTRVLIIMQTMMKLSKKLVFTMRINTRLKHPTCGSSARGKKTGFAL